MSVPYTFTPGTTIKADEVNANFGAFTAPSGSGEVGFLQSGSGAVARTSQAKMREMPCSLADFSGDAATALTSALAASDNIAIQTGSYNLATNVTLTGPVSWFNQGSWSGAGVINSATDYSGFNYSADFRAVRFAEGRGTAASPVTDKDATGLFSKHSNFSGGAGQQNPTLVAQAYKWNAASLTVAQAIFAEAIDKAGNGSGRTDFVEGIRAHGIGFGGNAYGGIFYAQLGDGITVAAAKIMFGTESETARPLGANAVDPVSWTSANNLDGAYLATVRQGGTPMAGYLVNPYNDVSYRCGFAVMSSFPARGAVTPTVNFASFFTNEASVPYGLFIRNSSFASISISNSSAVVAQNATDTAELNLMYLSGTDVLTIGQGTPATEICNIVKLRDIGDYASDAAAAAGGVPLRGVYHNAGALRMRIA